MSAVAVQVSSGVATIRVDRPPMNALDTVVQAGLATAAAEVTERDDVRAVIIYGGRRSSPPAPTSKEMAGWDYRTMILRSQTLQDSFTAIARIPKPTIAAVTGYALGGVGSWRCVPTCALPATTPNWGCRRSCSASSRAPAAPATATADRAGAGEGLILTGRFVDAEGAGGRNGQQGGRARTTSTRRRWRWPSGWQAARRWRSEPR